MPTDFLRILIAEPDDFPEPALAQLRNIGEVDLGLTSGTSLTSQFERYDLVFTRLAHRVEREDAPAQIRCQTIAVPTTGLDHIDTQWCAQVGIRVVSLRGEIEFLRTVRGTVEQTLALMFGVLRKLVPAHESVMRGEWRRDEFRGREISGSVVGIIGVGRIGSMVADAVHMLGAEVIGFDTASDWSHPHVHRAASLHELIERSNIISIHVPYNRGDRPVLGAHECQLMKPGAVVINTSRGGVIDDQALAHALVEKPLGGIGLDVLYGEPDIAENPLLEAARALNNVIITPHIGGNTYESRFRAEEFIVQRVLSLVEPKCEF